MKLISINGGYRRGKTIDTLVEKAIEGSRVNPETTVERIELAERNIRYCTNCMVCRKDDPSKEVAACPIDDDMREIGPAVQRADALIFASPINQGTVTAVMKTFFERTCWTLAKPGNRPMKGCPEPRVNRRKNAIIILSTGLVPPLLRRFCDDATPLIKSNCKICFGARVVGTLYAGAVEKRGIEPYLGKAFSLGRRIAGGKHAGT